MGHNHIITTQRTSGRGYDDDAHMIIPRAVSAERQGRVYREGHARAATKCYAGTLLLFKELSR